MVEGHSVHRIAVSHARRLVGKRVRACSPNGRFVDGAHGIDGSTLSRMEAIGKNLFAFWARPGQSEIVTHIHFGMSGRWSIVESAKAKEPKATTRLRIEAEGGLTCDLSAMTVQSGGLELFESKRASLGQDPLRVDADVEQLWSQVNRSKKSIGLMLMDQARAHRPTSACTTLERRCDLLSSRVPPLFGNPQGGQLPRHPIAPFTT